MKTSGPKAYAIPFLPSLPNLPPLSSATAVSSSDIQAPSECKLNKESVKCELIQVMFLDGSFKSNHLADLSRKSSVHTMIRNILCLEPGSLLAKEAQRAFKETSTLVIDVSYLDWHSLILPYILDPCPASLARCSSGSLLFLQGFATRWQLQLLQADLQVAWSIKNKAIELDRDVYNRRSIHGHKTISTRPVHYNSSQVMPMEPPKASRSYGSSHPINDVSICAGIFYKTPYVNLLVPESDQSYGVYGSFARSHDDETYAISCSTS